MRCLGHPDHPHQDGEHGDYFEDDAQGGHEACSVGRLSLGRTGGVGQRHLHPCSVSSGVPQTSK